MLYRMTAVSPLDRQIAQVFRVLRVRDWLHFVVLPVAGIDKRIFIQPVDAGRRLLLAMCCAACTLGYAYGLNVVADREMDIDSQKNSLRGVKDVPVWVLPLLGITCVGAVGLAFSLSQFAVISAVIALGAGTLYSAGPRLKSLPGVGTLMNVPIFAPLLAFAVQEPVPSGFSVIATTFVFLLLQNQILHECADMIEDARGEVRSTARFLGEFRSKLLILVLGLVGIWGVFWVGSNWVCQFISAIALLVGALVALIPKVSAKGRRKLHRILAIATGSVLMAVTLVASMFS